MTFRRIFRAAVVAAGLLAAERGAVADVLVPGGSFETPVLTVPPSPYQYTPPTTLTQPWTFTGNSGVTLAASPPGSSPFNMQNPPDGHQAAFIQDTFGVQSTISQTLNFLGGSTAISFYAEGRQYSTGGPNTNPISVLIDGVKLTFGGSTTVTPPTITTFTKFVSDAIVLSAGPHTLTFETAVVQTGTPNPDHTTFIDAVSTTLAPAVPEPSPMMLAGAAAAFSGLGVYFRKRKSTTAA